MKQRNLTEGNIAGNLICFALPMMAGNLLQQCYNIADTLIVGRFLGANALAAVGSSYSLMTFLTSILLGMCMGSGAVFSMCCGQKNEKRMKEVAGFSFLTCIQQSIMNFGILMVQGLVNSFGTAVMAAFAAGVKIDSFAYMPVQDFGNAFSTFIAQNYGAGKWKRIEKGIKSAVVTAFAFCAVISSVVFIFAEPLMTIFVEKSETEIISIGAGYLRIEGAFYFGIGLLFLLYGFYRAVKRPGMSVVLTILSLGTRVLLAYLLSKGTPLGVTGIWMSVPVGWVLADMTGVIYYLKDRKKLLQGGFTG